MSHMKLLGQFYKIVKTLQIHMDSSVGIVFQDAYLFFCIFCRFLSFLMIIIREPRLCVNKLTIIFC